MASTSTSSPSSASFPTYSYRAQKSIGLVEARPPAYAHSAALGDESQRATTAKVTRFDLTGRLFAYVAGSTVRIVDASSSSSDEDASSAGGSSSSSSSASQPRVELDVPGVIDVAFSPLGTYLFTWERLVKTEDGQPGHRNLKIWYLGSGSWGGGTTPPAPALVGAFAHKTYNGWEPQVTASESHLVRQSSTAEISVFALPATPADVISSSSPLADGTTADGLGTNAERFGLAVPVARARLTSGETIKDIRLGPASARTASNPSGQGSEGLAVWIGEHKGTPASVGLYTLAQILELGANGGTGALPPTRARKSFFFGDKVNVKWNRTGTACLFFTQSDVDNSGKSYYGETNLYLLALDGSFETKVALDKDGPIYDYDWHPSGREFAVVYGFMPARTVLFDAKARPVHSFGPQPRNFLSYQPQGRLFLSAGFGNLTGQVDVWDLRTRTKVAEWQAANSTTCEWSPCGKYVLTATLSPRLRVDNGVKVWWCAGGLLHVQPISELYQAQWRPRGRAATPDEFPSVIPPAPAPSQAVAQHAATAGAAPTPKPAGAYRPPGARGTLTPTIYKREDEGGAATSPAGNGGSVPGAGAAASRTNGAVSPAAGPGMRTPRQRQVPGAPPPGSDPSSVDASQANGVGKKKKGKKQAAQNGGAAVPAAAAVELAPVVQVDAPAPAGAGAYGEPTEADAVQKKIRNLTKKVSESLIGPGWSELTHQPCFSSAAQRNQ